MFYSVKYKNDWLAASDLFDMFTQPVKFYYAFYYHLLRVQMFEKCDSLKMNGCSFQQVLRVGFCLNTGKLFLLEISF